MRFDLRSDEGPHADECDTQQRPRLDLRVSGITANRQRSHERAALRRGGSSFSRRISRRFAGCGHTGMNLFYHLEFLNLSFFSSFVSKPVLIKKHPTEPGIGLGEAIIRPRAEGATLDRLVLEAEPAAAGGDGREAEQAVAAAQVDPAALRHGCQMATAGF